MTDEQIARAFVQQVRNHCPDAVAVLTLTAIIGEARTTERARCLGIVERYADLAEADWSVVEIYDDIKQG